MRFYLTTAIDYVNSRPHLGTAYEKVSADVIARYKRLCGIETHFLMGNDEHSQNVFRRARELGLDPDVYCDQMEQTFREVWSKLSISFDDFIRTTEPRHRAAVQRMAQACYDAGDVYEGHYEGWYCVSCEAFKQEKDLVDGKCPIHLTTPDWIREKNYFFRLSKYQQPLLEALRGAPGVHSARDSAKRDSAARRKRARRHFNQSRRPVVGHSVALRSRQRRLRLVRRADQLRRGRWIRHRRSAAGTVVAGEPACRGEGHHAVSLRRLAGHVDERGIGTPRNGLRPRVGALPGTADEQVAGYGGRSARSRRSPRAGSAALVPDEGDPVRRRRRFLVGALRGALQRRSRQQPRQPRQPRDDDGREVSWAAVSSGSARAGTASGAGRGDCRGLSRGDGPICAARGGRRHLRARRRDQRVHRGVYAMAPGERRGARRRARPSAVRRRRGAPDRRRVAAADHADVGRPRFCAAWASRWRRAIFVSIVMPRGRRPSRARFVKGQAIWPRLEPRDPSQGSSGEYVRVRSERLAAIRRTSTSRTVTASRRRTFDT